MTGLKYMTTVCPTTRVGKDPLREDVVDAFEDGVAEGWRQCKEKQWKPSEGQIKAVEDAIEFLGCTKKVREDLKSLYDQLKKLKGS